MPAESMARTAGAQARDAAGSRKDRLSKAVHRYSALSRSGMSERLFTWLFRGLVYPQIWEDPVVDMAALELGPDKRLVTIASGGCNVMSYLTADPKQIIAVDLNKYHVALVRLKLAGAKHLPSYQAFYGFFGEARSRVNYKLFDDHLADKVDAETRAHWNRRDWLLRRRVSLFSRDIYRYGLLGRFIGVGHLAARAFGVPLQDLATTRNQQEQQAYFDRVIAPIFETRFVRWVTSSKASLFGLGIPPAQYDSLAQAGGGDMALVLKQRLEKLFCDFPLSENYFAWQAFARRYAPGDSGPLPPYLQSANFEAVRARADRATVENVSVTERMAQEPDGSLHAYVLLDAQDWMTDEQLNALWSEITRTAAPGARVIFRTADEPSLLPGRVRPEILDRWDYQAEKSAEYCRQDRSAIYGGFHLYVFRG